MFENSPENSESPLPENEILSFWKNLNLPQKGFVIIGLALLAVGGTLFLKSVFTDDSTVEIVQSSPLALSAATENSQKIFVDVSGAVVAPGVYQLSAGDRLQNALVAAGGLAANADRVWVSQNLNLAAKISDGQKIYVPIASEKAASSSNPSNPSNPSALINLNTASSSQLDTLPGIGPATAAKIISNRPYTDTQELITKKVVSQKVFDQIKDKVSVY